MALVIGTNCGFCSSAPSADPGGTPVVLDSYTAAAKFDSPAGTNSVSEMGWWCDNDTQAVGFELGIYSHDADNGKPNLLLAASSETAKGTTGGWKTAAVSYGLTASTSYWLAAQLDNTSTTTNIDYLGNVAYAEAYKATQTTLPSPWGSSTGTAARIIAVYAAYSEGAAPLEVNVFDNIVTTDYIDASIPVLEVNVNDNIGVADAPSAQIPILAILVFSLIGLTDIASASIPVLEVSVYDNIGVAEDVSASISVLNVNVSDNVGTTDSTDASIPVLEVAVYDVIGLSDVLSSQLPLYEIFVNNVIGMTDVPDVTVSGAALSVYVFDTEAA